jgi:type I restriction enzyme S subunit
MRAESPSSRFPGFNESWKEQRLEKFFTSSRAKGSDGMPTLSVTLNRGLINRDDIDRKTETNLEADEHLLVREGDIAYNMMRMWQGAFGRSDREGIVSPAYVVLRPLASADSGYFEYAFRRPRSIYLFWAYSYGITNDRLRLYADDFRRIPLAAPTLPEQRKIAAFLTAVDGRLEQLRQKQTLLADYKRGVIQQLFTQALRFKDNHGQDFPDWEIAEFGKIAKRSSEKHNPMTSKTEYPSVELESLSQDTGQLLQLFVSTDQKSIKSKFTKGDVLFGKLRPYLRKWLLAKFDGVCSSENWVLKGRTVTNAYLFYLLQTDEFMKATNVSSGSKMPRADWSHIATVSFSYPTARDEQTKIAAFLSALDRKSESVAAQLDQTRTFKQGLLQQLFV